MEIVVCLVVFAGASGISGRVVFRFSFGLGILVSIRDYTIRTTS